MGQSVQVEEKVEDEQQEETEEEEETQEVEEEETKEVEEKTVKQAGEESKENVLSGQVTLLTRDMLDLHVEKDDDKRLRQIRYKQTKEQRQ